MAQPESASENSTEAGELVTGISRIVDDHQYQIAVHRGAPLISDVDHKSQLDSLIRETVEKALSSFSRTMTRKLDDLKDQVTLKLDDLTEKMSKLETTVGVKEDDERNDDWLTLLCQDFTNSSFYVSPHLTSGSRHVFIRESYRDICKALLKIQSDSPSRNMKYLITGTPGIGKSHFAFYLLHHLLAEPGNSVLYQNCHVSKNYSVVLKRKDGNDYSIQHYRGSDIKQVDYLNHVSWYIFDGWHTHGPLPQHCDAPTIVISSPNYSQYKEYCQDNPVKLYMPPWTWEEIERLITVLQANGETVNKQNAEKAFGFWGGVVREVLSPNVDKRKEVLDGVIESAQLQSNVDSMVQFVQACGEVSQCVSHKILHQKPTVDEHGTVDYRQTRIVFASEYVKKRIMEIHSRLESVDNLIKAAKTMYVKNDKRMREVCGFFFELAVHKGIESNCKYEARYLGKWKGGNNSRPGYVMPEFSNHRPFESLMQNIEDPEWRLPREYEMCYLEPERCFPAIDSFIPQSKVFFQITIKRDHKVEVETPWKLMKALEWKPEDVHLIFVTLPEVFDDFKVQIPNSRNEDGCKAFKKVRQYVMKFPTIPKSDFPGEERFV
jgi:hypothetical protein